MTGAPTIAIDIVCSPEQRGDVQARVSALQADLDRLGIAFSVTVRRDPQAFLAGFAETERSVHVDPELARRQRELLLEEHDG